MWTKSVGCNGIEVSAGIPSRWFLGYEKHRGTLTVCIIPFIAIHISWVYYGIR